MEITQILSYIFGSIILIGNIVTICIYIKD